MNYIKDLQDILNDEISEREKKINMVYDYLKNLKFCELTIITKAMEKVGKDYQ